MKNLKYHALLSSVVALALCGCGDDVAGQWGQGKGKISLDVDVNTAAKAGKGSRAFADDGVVAPEDLSIRLTSADGSFSQSWGTLAEFGQKAEFAVGSYTLEAYFGAADDQGFEKPYIYGSAPVKVRNGETTQVGLTATLSNSMFSISYSEGMKKYLQSYSAELLSQGATEPVAYSADETRPAYLPAGMTDVYVSVTKPSGTSAKLLAASVDAKPQHHYLISIDIKGGAGAETLTVSFDDALETEDYVIELNDELMNTTPPAVTADGFDPAVPVDVMAGTPYDGKLGFSIMARGKIGQVKLATSAPELLGANWPAEIELVGLSEADQALYAGMGLSVRGLWRNPDMQALLDLAGLLKNTVMPAGADEASLQFTLTAVDRYGKVSEPATLTVNMEKEAVSLEPIEGEKLMFGNTTHKMLLGYNGADPAENVEIQFKTERGTWQSMPILTATQLESRSATKHYEITFNVDEESSYVLRAATKSGSCVSSEQGIEVKRVMSETFDVAAANVFATSAYVTVLEGEGAKAGTSYAQYATLYVSTDNATWTLAQGAPTDDNAHYLITGLQPATAYYLKATLTGEEADARAAAQAFTTEAATQLANSGMEDWLDPTNVHQYWQVENIASPWATLNELTTSEGGSTLDKEWFSQVYKGNGGAFAATSGTSPTNDAHTGAKAALIETVGWGAGNKVGGSNLTYICDNVTAGELYLGVYESAPVYGIDFESRPSSLAFYYKYTAKNSSDFGSVEIQVLDESGNVVASQQKNLTAASEYTMETLTLDYNVLSAKAKKIIIVFKSSANDSCLSYNETNMTKPSRDYSSRYVGSQLFVDDIILNY